MIQQYRVYFLWIWMGIFALSPVGVYATDTPLHHTHTTYPHQTSNPIVLNRLTHPSKTGLTYFLANKVTDADIAHIKKILHTYGGNAYWIDGGNVTIHSDTMSYQIPPTKILLHAPQKIHPSDTNDTHTVHTHIDAVQQWIRTTIHTDTLIVITAADTHQDLDIITTNRTMATLARYNDFTSAQFLNPYMFKSLTQVTTSPKNPTNVLDFVNQFYGVIPHTYTPWTPLKKGAVIDLVAPSSEYPESYIQHIKTILNKQGFVARDIYAIQAPKAELFYSNTTEQRLSQLVKALNTPDSDAVWIIRGGGGMTNLLPYMLTLPKPKRIKPVIGFSDTTGLHLFLNTRWNIPTIHGVVAQYNQEMLPHTKSKVNKHSSMQSVLDILTTKTSSLQYDTIVPMNEDAMNTPLINGRILGGNLTLVTSLLDGYMGIPNTTQPPYILLLEGIGNGLHQTERMLDSIAYSPRLNNMQAIILGDFVTYNRRMDTAEYRTLMHEVLQRFARKVAIPVFRLHGIGHGKTNHPIPLNTPTQIKITPHSSVLTIRTK